MFKQSNAIYIRDRIMICYLYNNTLERHDWVVDVYWSAGHLSMVLILADPVTAD